MKDEQEWLESLQGFGRVANVIAAARQANTGNKLAEQEARFRALEAAMPNRPCLRVGPIEISPSPPEMPRTRVGFSGRQEAVDEFGCPLCNTRIFWYGDGGSCAVGTICLQEHGIECPRCHFSGSITFARVNHECLVVDYWVTDLGSYRTDEDKPVELYGKVSAASLARARQRAAEFIAQANSIQ